LPGYENREIMRFRNRYNINLYANPLKRDSASLDNKNRLEAEWYDDEADAAFSQISIPFGSLPMDTEFEDWFGEFYDNPTDKFPYDRDWAYFSAFSHGKDLKFLELGFGNGCLSRFFLRRGIDVYSNEISMKYSLFLMSTNHDAKAVRSCAEILPYKDNSFDLVATFLALHHFNLDLSLEEIYRVLKPGGKAVFMEPLLNSKILYLVRQFIPVSDNESAGGGGINSVELQRKLKAIGFRYRIREYELLTRLERIPVLNKFQRTLRKIDYAILLNLPFLRHLARTTVIEIFKPA
jgi:SAM-dependent methyltransferase